MKFTYIRQCRRTEAEQRYIHASLEIWSVLPELRRVEARRLMGEIAQTTAERQALFNVLTRGITPQAEAVRTGVQNDRLYRMRREFYDRFLIA